MAGSQKNYIQGLFATTVDGKYGPVTFIHGDNNVLRQIANLPRNAEGQWSLVAVPQKNNKNKLSIYEGEVQNRSEGQQRGQGGRSGGGYGGNRSAPRSDGYQGRSQQSASPKYDRGGEGGYVDQGNNDDLPF